MTRDPRMTKGKPTTTLSPREKQAIDLRAAGLSGKEIAAEMGITPDTVRNVLAKARVKMAEAKCRP